MGHSKLNEDEVKRMYVEEQKSTHEIAAALRCTPSGISTLLNRIGVPLRSRGGAAESRTRRALGFVPTKEWLVEAMSAFGGNALACATFYQFNYSTFVDVLRRHGIPRLAPEHRHELEQPEWVETAAELSTSRVSYEDIASRFGVSTAMVAYHLKKVGHEAPRNKQKRYAGRKTLTTPKRKALQDLLDSGVRGCQICGHDRHFDLAHIVPKAKGGPMVADNVLLLCPSHHRSFDRGTLLWSEFGKVENLVRAAEEKYRFLLEAYIEPERL